MKLQQLRYIDEVARQGLNVSAAATSLHTSQSGISKQIKLLEEELGIEVFVRQGKRVVAVTAPGKIILDIARRMLADAENLRRAAGEYLREDAGSLAIATTHTQARYALPATIKRFTERYPAVRLTLLQGTPVQVCDFVIAGQADLCIATEAIERFDELAMLPCYQWGHCVLAPFGHPILDEQALSLESIAKYPVITYDLAFTGRSRINRAFEQRGLTPDIALNAVDSDVIKTYVALGLGIGIAAKMSFDPNLDDGLRALDASHLFGSNTTHIGIRRNAFLRGYVYEFIGLFAPHLDRKTIESAISGRSGSDYAL